MAVRKLVLFAALAACLAVAGPAWAGSLSFHGNSAGEGELSFTPGVGNDLTIGAGNGANGAVVTDFYSTGGAAICGGDCTIVGGYLTLSTGGETSGGASGGSFLYDFGSGGTIKIVGEIPSLGINSPTTLFMASLVSGQFSGTGTIGSVIVAINLSSIVLAPQLGSYHFTGANNNDIAFDLSSTCATGGVCTGPIIQSDTNFQTIPEPATLSVLGVGLFAFGTGLRRRMAATKAA
jgi:PEP-CTERM motif